MIQVAKNKCSCKSCITAKRMANDECSVGFFCTGEFHPIRQALNKMEEAEKILKDYLKRD